MDSYESEIAFVGAVKLEFCRVGRWYCKLIKFKVCLDLCLSVGVVFFTLTVKCFSSFAAFSCPQVGLWKLGSLKACKTRCWESIFLWFVIGFVRLKIFQARCGTSPQGTGQILTLETSGTICIEKLRCFCKSFLCFLILLSAFEVRFQNYYKNEDLLLPGSCQRSGEPGEAPYQHRKNPYS